MTPEQRHVNALPGTSVNMPCQSAINSNLFPEQRAHYVNGKCAKRAQFVIVDTVAARFRCAACLWMDSAVVAKAWFTFRFGSITEQDRAIFDRSPLTVDMLPFVEI